jgi:3'-phosphoadenosine 5'-phosphosulfate sulfotransferase (PAPS reductase)/FAD synthetase
MRPPVDFSRLEGQHSIVLLFSGGKDSLALVYLFKPYLGRITLLHVDAGDLLPEMRELVAVVEKSVPHFVRVATDAPAWIAANALPSELVPVRAHPAARAFLRGARHSIVPMVDCCDHNRWRPMQKALAELAPSLVLNGQRRADEAILGAGTASVPWETWYPIADWSAADVLAYLTEVEAPVLPFYSYRPQAPECATCPASWDEGRAAYLAKHHPDLSARYAGHLAVHAAEMADLMADFIAECQAAGVKVPSRSGR